MKRSPLNRRTPLDRTSTLQRAGQLARSGPLNARSAKTADVYVARRALVADLLRGARCEMVHDDGTRCPRPATDPHEVWSRGRGGSILDRDNVLPLCRECHDHVTTHPAWAEQIGYLCPSWSGQAGIAEAARVRRLRAAGRSATADYRRPDGG